MRDIQQALEEHKQAVINAGFNENRIFAICLYGSQNYGLSTENSDVDTKAIIIPTLKDLCNFTAKKPYVKELELPNNEKCVIMDIRHLVENLLKQNINYVEVLYTKYNWINPKYQRIWNELQDIKEQIAYYDVNRGIQSMAHQALHTLMQDPFNCKKYANALYIDNFLQIYAREESKRVSYLAALYPSPHVQDYILNVKMGKVNYDLEDVYILRKRLEQIVKMKPLNIDTYKQNKINRQLLTIITWAVRTLDNL